MKNWKSISIVGVLVLLSVFSFTYAQTKEEAILDFVVTITVNSNRSVSVEEKIVYDSGPIDRHGIYRDIRMINSEGERMSLSNIDVRDENGMEYEWERIGDGGNSRIKIGDPDKTFRGTKIYLIKYTASNAAVLLENLDEIYWNVTGNEWNVPILKANATVVLPYGAIERQSACYYGAFRSQNICSGTITVSGYQFESPEQLEAGEGLTVAVGFEKGAIYPPTIWEKFVGLMKTYGGIVLGGVLFLVIFFRLFYYWWTKGRDPRGTSVIVPQYDVPDNLTPFEVGGIVRQRIDTKDVSAEIIYLATKGYIKIRQIESKIPLFGKDDYELILLKDAEGATDLEKEFISNLFGSTVPPASVKISALRNKFYMSFLKLSKMTMKRLKELGYYDVINLSGVIKKGDPWIIIPSLLLFVSLIVGGVIGLGEFYLMPMVFTVIVTFLFFVIFLSIMPARSKRGVATREYLLGLKDYLDIAEKDRLEFHNAPEKKPEIFEKLLPFAIVFGVEKQWAREFEEIYTTPPSWYEGHFVGAFNSVIFANSISEFNTQASSSLSSAPGGGSGGGGFSGGGGGGGGGGGW